MMQKKVKYCPLMIVILSVICLNLFYCAEDNRRDDPELEKILENINGEPVIPRTANRLYLPYFNDRTKIEGLREKLYNRLKESISREGRLAVVTDPELSDVALQGIITSCQIQPMDYNSFGVAEKKRMRITVAVKLTRTLSGRTIFYEPDLQAFKEYSDIIPPAMSESQALENVLVELAQRITAKTITGWYTELMTPVERGKSK